MLLARLMRSKIRDDLSNEYSPADIDKVHSLMSEARTNGCAKRSISRSRALIETPARNGSLLTQMKELEKAEEAQRNALAGDNADASGSADAKQIRTICQWYSSADIDKVHSLMSARGMDVPKEALVEILKLHKEKSFLRK